MEFKMRLSEDDERKLVAVEAWYHGLARAAVMRLALVELHRYVIGAKRRKEEAKVLAEHMPKRAPVDLGPEARLAATKERERKAMQYVEAPRSVGVRAQLHAPVAMPTDE